MAYLSGHQPNNARVPGSSPGYPICKKMGESIRECGDIYTFGVGEPSLRRKGSNKHAVVLGSTLGKSILCASLNALEARGEIFLGCALHKGKQIDQAIKQVNPDSNEFGWKGFCAKSGDEPVCLLCGFAERRKRINTIRLLHEVG